MRGVEHGAGHAALTAVMSNDEDRTLVRGDRGPVGPTLVSPRRNAYAPPPPRPEPTSWNGISYDDMMRSLEDAFPATDRRTTIVDALAAAPTRPAELEPFPLTQRMPGRPRAEAEIEQEHTKLMVVQQHHALAHVVPSTVAPVALPTRYVDLDGDVDLDLDTSAPRAFASGTPSRKGLKTKAIFAGAALGMVIALGGYARVNPDARTSASSAASNARARVSSWVSDAKAPPPAVAAVAPVAPVAPIAPAAEPAHATPAVTNAPPVPTMRAPTAPPVVRKAKTVKRVDADEAKPAEAEADADPTSLLDRGLGN